MNEELSAYTFDVNKKLSLNGIGIVGFKDQTTDTGIWISKHCQKQKSSAPGVLDEFQLHLLSLFFRNAGIT